MNYFDSRTSRALMDQRLEQARNTPQRRRSGLPALDGIRERLGAWMIARGEKLVSKEPKIA
jgi:hypothetical protein